jgi:hypothetical protein
MRRAVLIASTLSFFFSHSVAAAPAPAPSGALAGCVKTLGGDNFSTTIFKCGDTQRLSEGLVVASERFERAIAKPGEVPPASVVVEVKHLEQDLGAPLSRKNEKLTIDGEALDAVRFGLSNGATEVYGGWALSIPLARGQKILTCGVLGSVTAATLVRCREIIEKLAIEVLHEARLVSEKEFLTLKASPAAAPPPAAAGPGGIPGCTATATAEGPRVNCPGRLVDVTDSKGGQTLAMIVFRTSLALTLGVSSKKLTQTPVPRNVAGADRQFTRLTAPPPVPGGKSYLGLVIPIARGAGTRIFSCAVLSATPADEEGCWPILDALLGARDPALREILR